MTSRGRPAQAQQGVARSHVLGDSFEAVLARLEVVTTADRSAGALVTAMAGIPERSAIVCGYVELYASDREQVLQPDTVQEGLHGESVRMFQTERLVAHGLAGLAGALRPHLSTPGAPYVICVAGCGSLGEFRALTDEGFNRVAWLEASQGSSVHELDAWASRLRERAPVEEIRARIVAAGDDGPEVDRVLALALARAERPAEAYAVFARTLPTSGATARSGVLSAAAMLALQAGELDAAASLIDRVLADPRSTRMDLRSVAQNASLLRDRGRTRRAAEMLQEFYPDDELGLVLLADQQCREGQFSRARALLAPHAGRLADEGRYVLARASHRCGRCVGIHAFQASVPEAMRARAICDEIYCAIAEKEWVRVDAAIQVIEPDCLYQEEIVRALCRALEVWCLTVGSMENDAALDHPRRWMHQAVTLLAARPTDTTGRLRLEDITDGGALGESVSYELLGPMVEAPADTGDCPPAPDIPPSDEREMREFSDFMRSLVAQQGRIHLVPKRLDRSLDTATAGRLIRGGMQIVDEGLVKPDLEETDVGGFILLLSGLLDVVHTAHDTATPRGASLAIAMVHRVVARLAMQGLGQPARDLVETVMHIAGGTREAAVLADAWLALADVRQRGHQPLLALLALAHASRLLPADPTRRLTYHAVAIRVFRNMHLLDAASGQMRAYSAIAETRPDLVAPGQRNSLGWSLALAHAARHAGSETWASDHGERVAAVAREAFSTVDADDEAAPHRMVAATNLVHAIQLLRDHEIPLPVDESKLRSKLSTLGSAAPGTFQALITDTPSFAQFRRAVETSIAARHSSDLLPDTRPARVIARKILDGELNLASRAATLEVLSDLESGHSAANVPLDARVARAATARIFERARDGRTIDGIVDILSRSESTETTHGLLAVLADPPAFLADLLDIGRDGVLLEATSLLAGGLGHLRIDRGAAHWTVEPTTIFDPHRLGAYERDYPYAFHTLDDRSFDPEGDVAHALGGLGLSPIASNVTLRCVVPDHRLLAIPANLQPLGDELAGDLYPICQAPSLAWLRDAHAARSRPPVAWRATAWILGEDPQAFASTLAVGAQSLTDLLGPFGVKIQRDVELSAVRSDPVMWIMAHGGLGLDARHFARISNDRQDRHPAADLVAAAEGASLVVLLVCSGGRGSHDLFTERVRGLPTALLRRGVRTVVASPWPLDVIVGALWSEAFARRLRAGDAAAAATFAANRTLANRHPKHRLAMHVHGDPWLCVVVE